MGGVSARLKVFRKTAEHLIYNYKKVRETEKCRAALLPDKSTVPFNCLFHVIRHVKAPQSKSIVFQPNRSLVLYDQE